MFSKRRNGLGQSAWEQVVVTTQAAPCRAHLMSVTRPVSDKARRDKNILLREFQDGVSIPLFFPMNRTFSFSLPIVTAAFFALSTLSHGAPADPTEVQILVKPKPAMSAASLHAVLSS